MTLNQIVEALLFASPEPLTAKAVAKLVRDVAEREEGKKKDKALKKVTAKDVTTAISELIDAYDKDGTGFTAEERAGGWKLYSRADYGEFVKELFPSKKSARLSPPALETLAIVAYRQPLTRAAMEAVRGVAVDGVVQTLIDRNLIRIAGRADLPGRPMLYETTEHFLEYFGIKSPDDLPNAAELRQVALPQPEEEIAAAEEQLPLGDISGDEAEDAEVAEGEEGADTSEDAAEKSDESADSENSDSADDQSDESPDDSAKEPATVGDSSADS